jgi:hypothetical protein
MSKVRVVHDPTGTRIEPAIWMDECIGLLASIHNWLMIDRLSTLPNR